VLVAVLPDIGMIEVEMPTHIGMPHDFGIERVSASGATVAAFLAPPVLEARRGVKNQKSAGCPILLI
jgi:hypothetical protein